MKEQKDTTNKTSLLEAGRRRNRESRPSMSSRRSVRSDGSDTSRRSRSRGRPRGLSFTSIYSNAVSDGSNESVSTNALSRKTSHADDSDASDSNSSLGETDQDVWFPNDAQGNGDINLDELDQLLNLSDDDSNHRPGGEPGAPMPVPAVVVDAGDAAGDDGPPAEPGARSGRSKSVSTPTRAASSAKERPSTENFRPTPINEGAGQFPKKHFVQYTRPSGSPVPSPGGEPRPFAEEAGPGGGDECPSTGSSDNVDKEKEPHEETVTTTRMPHPIHLPSTKLDSGLGEVPNADQQSQRFSFYAPGLDNTIHAPDLASLVGNSDSFSSLLDPSNGTWFLDCFRPTDVEMKALSRAFGIHPLTTEDIQTEDAREKYEQFKNYYLVVYHTFENDKEDPNYMEAINFYVLVFKEGVISFHFEPVSHCRNVRRRMRQLRDYVDFTPDWIAYALIDDITDSFAPEIGMVEKEADFVEDAVYLDTNAEIGMHTLLRRLGLARRHTMQLLRMLSGKADVVRGFAKRCTELHSMPASEMGLYLGDIQDHIVTMYQNLSAYEKIFSRSHFNYMGLLQMEFVDSSNRMTGVLGKVTMLGSILLPMNLITGLFGMNVKVPGQDGTNLNWFFGILAVIIFLCMVLLASGVLYLKLSIRQNKGERT